MSIHDHAPIEPCMLLFICTGNYYRSRFAEAVFNHHAQKMALTWRAFSRGLAIHLAAGDLSPYTAQALEARGIDCSCTGPTRQSLRVSDLLRASRIIALDEAEHRPLLRLRFPDWEDVVTYWSVSDIDRTLPEQALPAIEGKVRDELLASLVDVARSAEQGPVQ
jgi:protein-tyrosine phosphatase